MKHITELDGCFENTCVSFGYFDGVHIGHQAVLDRMQEETKNGLTPLLLSFVSGTTQKKLSTEAEKIFLLKDRNGIMISILTPQQPAPSETFVREVLLQQLGARVVVVGETCEWLPLLLELSAKEDFSLVVCPTVFWMEEPATSRRAVQLLTENKMDELSHLLGHPYLILGKVVEGKQLGRTVGMPTANIEYFEDKHIPPEGVYATLATVEDKQRKSLTNIGRRPSVDSFDYVTVECFLLNFSGDLYGKFLPLEVHSYVRGTRKFSNLNEVKAQVEHDIQSIRECLKKLAD